MYISLSLICLIFGAAGVASSRQTANERGLQQQHQLQEQQQQEEGEGAEGKGRTRHEGKATRQMKENGDEDLAKREAGSVGGEGDQAKADEDGEVKHGGELVERKRKRGGTKIRKRKRRSSMKYHRSVSWNVYDLDSPASDEVLECPFEREEGNYPSIVCSKSAPLNCETLWFNTDSYRIGMSCIKTIIPQSRRVDHRVQ
ncbi:uncharacterized protein LOC122242958 [Penaeus japonicus]|uniref:uncharacterized protein LOC122242958 n=1 Tax=Penaeus japonicus TaxID=27405 RepID=UPI001C70F2DD|nr:uncharacterized protein LOC122242958 [Penaeus japonicus]